MAGLLGLFSFNLLSSVNFEDNSSTEEYFHSLCIEMSQGDKLAESSCDCYAKGWTFIVKDRADREKLSTLFKVMLNKKTSADSAKQSYEYLDNKYGDKLLKLDIQCE